MTKLEIYLGDWIRLKYVEERKYVVPKKFDGAWFQVQKFNRRGRPTIHEKVFRDIPDECIQEIQPYAYFDTEEDD